GRCRGRCTGAASRTDRGRSPGCPDCLRPATAAASSRWSSRCRPGAGRSRRRSICRKSNSRSICLSEILQSRRRLRRSRRRIWRSDLFYQLVSLLFPLGGLFDLRRLSIFVCHPAIPGTDEERSKLAHRFGVLVFFPNAVRIGATPPLAENDDVSGSVLVDKNLMRHIAFKAAHVRPNFTRET